MEAKLKVKLLEHTPNPEKIIATAAKLCYSYSDIESLSGKQTDEVVEAFLEKLIAMGHESPVEHVSFTFAVEGVSRTLTHQLVRHRIASYSQQSQRYVKLNQFEYVIPPAIKESPLAANLYVRHMENCQEAYSLIAAHLYNEHSYRMATDELKSRGIIVPGEDPMSQLDEASKRRIIREADKMAIEDARYAFPNACETKIIVTMNARTLLNFFKHRCCNRAQWEIRELADKMLTECKKVAPLLFSKCGPSCAFRQCGEGSMSCGKQLEMKSKYNDEVWL